MKVLLSLISLVIHTAPDGVRMEVSIQTLEYCRQADGSPVLRLNVSPVYKNSGTATLIIPRLSYVREEIISQGGRIVQQSETSRHRLDGISSAVYSAATPDPSLFFFLKPGEKAPGVQRTVLVPIRMKKAGGKVLRAGSYSLSIVVDHGPQSGIRTLPWLEMGTLVTGEIRSSAAYLQVPTEEPTATCQGPPILRERLAR